MFVMLDAIIKKMVKSLHKYFKNTLEDYINEKVHLAY